MARHARGSAGDSEEGYLASVGDLMSAILFVFIIAVVTFAAELAREKERVTSEVAGIRSTRDSLVTAIGDSLKRDHIAVIVDIDRGVIRLSDRVVFGQGADSLGATERKNVSRLAAVLAHVLPRYAAGGESRQKLEAVFVEGHADSVPIKNAQFKDNLDLSASRARTVYLELLNAEASLDGLRNPDALFLFSASGYGATRPVASNATQGGRAQNRRIDLRFVMAAPRRERMDSALVSVQ